MRAAPSLLLLLAFLSPQDASLRWRMALWARPASRCCCWLKAACAAELQRLRSSSKAVQACQGAAPLVLLASRHSFLPWGLQTYRRVSVENCSKPASAEDGSSSSPESNLLLPVKQEQAKPETIPDLNTEILCEGKRP